MSSDVAAILVANLLMFVLGVGLLPLLRLAATPRELLLRLPLAYAVGIAGTGILAAELALVHVSVGRIVLPLLAFGTLALGLRRLERRSLRPLAWPSPWALPGLALLAVALVYLANASRLFAVKPLFENDGWALWGLRAQALYEAGHPLSPVFTDDPYPALQYPLLLPGLEAIDAHFLGRFDGTPIHLQLLGMAVAFVLAAWTLLRGHSPSLLLSATVLAIVTAPAFLRQLETNSADVPLAMAIALGVTALAAWLRTGARGLLPTTTLFLAAGAMTKNEGELFALAAFLAALLVAPRGRRRPLLWAAAAWAALILPWHVWLLANGVTSTSFALSHLLSPTYLGDHAARVSFAADKLLDQIWLGSSWSRLPLLIVVGVVLAFALRHFRVASFGVAWLLLAFGGLLLVYWASPFALDDTLYSSADRTIDTLVIGGALLVPVLLGAVRAPPPVSETSLTPPEPPAPR